jgi:uncharacterized protein (DUF433 family)
MDRLGSKDFLPAAAFGMGNTSLRRPVSCSLAALDWYAAVMASASNVIVKDPEILGGTPVFRGTWVPFKNLLDYLERGHALAEFLRQFPTVTREMAIAALEQARLS